MNRKFWENQRDLVTDKSQLFGSSEQRASGRGRSGNDNGIIGTNGRAVRFSVNSRGRVTIQSRNADHLTEKYIRSMALTPTSVDVLLEIRDGDIKIEIKNLTQRENDALIEGKPFDYISGVTLAKEQYYNLQSYISGQITREDYIINDEMFRAKALSENGSFNESSRIGRVEQIKLEQYLEQVILINEKAINSDREYFTVALEESIHSLQGYIETYYKSDNKNSYADYLDLRHEKEAREEVDKALKEYDEI